MNAQAYLGAVDDRLRVARYMREPSAGTDQVVAYRSDFRWRWMGSKLHTLVVVSAAPVATDDGLARFAKSSLEWGKVTKGQMRGMQSGVAVITAVVADHADDSAVEFARTKLVRAYAAFAWPVLVDLGRGQRVSHVGHPMVGALFTGWMRQQIAAVLPEPARGDIS